MISPNEFEREFGRLKSDLLSLTARDLKLLRMVDFMPLIGKASENPLFDDYIREFVSLVKLPVTRRDVYDLYPDELSKIADMFDSLSQLDSVTGNRKLSESHSAATNELARKLIYVGEIDKAVHRLAELFGVEIEDKKLDSLESAIDTVSDDRISSVLDDVRKELDEYRTQGSDSSVLALFVEKSDGADTGRGRLRTLRATVEALSKNAGEDTLVFDNVPKAPDDPFVGAAYKAVNAVRRFRSKSRNGLDRRTKYNLRLSIDDSDHTFTGDSIGLAAALITDVHLRSEQVKTRKSLVACDVAVTGGIDEQGNVTAVNEESLSAKIQRAFFSPVRNIAVPEANFDTARSITAKLNETYPNRGLHIAPVVTLADATENRNIIRDERVCPLDLAKNAAKIYGRMVRVQVPVLLILTYLLLCLIYPKARIGFDWRIAEVELHNNELIALNKDNHEIWASEIAETDDGSEFSLPQDNSEFAYAIANLDNDNRDEVFVAMGVSGNKTVRNGLFRYYDDKGDLKWEQAAYVPTSYPGDKAYPELEVTAEHGYSRPRLCVIRHEDRDIGLVTLCSASYPARMQIMFWGTDSIPLSGPYLHRGHIGHVDPFVADIDANGDLDLVICGTNNGLKRAFLMVVPLDSLSGVSPPYDHEYFRASAMDYGSHSVYLAFPRTSLSELEDGIRNFVQDVSNPRSDGKREIVVVEGVGAVSEHSGKRISRSDLPTVHYTLDSNFTPLYVRFPDGSFYRLNHLLKQNHIQPYMKADSLRQSLKDRVAVYHGGKLISGTTD